MNTFKIGDKVEVLAVDEMDEDWLTPGMVGEVRYCIAREALVSYNGYFANWSYLKDLELVEPVRNSQTKDTNPKDSIGTKKVPLSGMPAPVLMECGLVKLHGDLKYGRYNWRDAGVRASVYYDACMRHLMAWWEGEDIDPDSGEHHIAHAITGLSVLRDAQMQSNCTDDRPKASSVGWVSAMNVRAEKMIEKHEDQTK